MPTTRTNACYLLTLWLSASIALATDPTPVPQPFTTFQVPLTNKTLADASLLPIGNGQAYVVYATPAGKTVSFLLTPTSLNPTVDPTPVPTPPAPPAPPPTPTKPTKLKIAVVENPATTTPEQRTILADPTWRNEAKKLHTFLGVIPNDAKGGTSEAPPADVAPFLDRAKLHNLPWLMLSTDDGTIVWEGQLPATSQAITDTIHANTGTANGTLLHRP